MLFGCFYLLLFISGEVTNLNLPAIKGVELNAPWSSISGGLLLMFMLISNIFFLSGFFLFSIVLGLINLSKNKYYIFISQWLNNFNFN